MNTKDVLDQTLEGMQVLPRVKSLDENSFMELLLGLAEVVEKYTEGSYEITCGIHRHYGLLILYAPAWPDVTGDAGYAGGYSVVSYSEMLTYDSVRMTYPPLEEDAAEEAAEPVGADK